MTFQGYDVCSAEIRINHRLGRACINAARRLGALVLMYDNVLFIGLSDLFLTARENKV